MALLLPIDHLLFRRQLMLLTAGLLFLTPTCLLPFHIDAPSTCSSAPVGGVYAAKFNSLIAGPRAANKHKATRPRTPLSHPPIETSVGSVGHPLTCGEACKYARKPKGCKDGAHCKRCHHCVWSRYWSKETTFGINGSCGGNAGARTTATAATARGTPALPQEQQDYENNFDLFQFQCMPCGSVVPHQLPWCVLPQPEQTVGGDEHAVSGTPTHQEKSHCVKTPNTSTTPQCVERSSPGSTSTGTPPTSEGATTGNYLTPEFPPATPQVTMQLVPVVFCSPSSWHHQPPEEQQCFGFFPPSCAMNFDPSTPLFQEQTAAGSSCSTSMTTFLPSADSSGSSMTCSSEVPLPSSSTAGAPPGHWEAVPASGLMSNFSHDHEELRAGAVEKETQERRGLPQHPASCSSNTTGGPIYFDPTVLRFQAPQQQAGLRFAEQEMQRRLPCNNSGFDPRLLCFQGPEQHQGGRTPFSEAEINVLRQQAVSVFQEKNKDAEQQERKAQLSFSSSVDRPSHHMIMREEAGKRTYSKAAATVAAPATTGRGQKVSMKTDLQPKRTTAARAPAGNKTICSSVSTPSSLRYECKRNGASSRPSRRSSRSPSPTSAASCRATQEVERVKHSQEPPEQGPAGACDLLTPQPSCRSNAASKTPTAGASSCPSRLIHALHIEPGKEKERKAFRVSWADLTSDSSSEGESGTKNKTRVLLHDRRKQAREQVLKFHRSMLKQGINRDEVVDEQGAGVRDVVQNATTVELVSQRADQQHNTVVTMHNNKNLSRASTMDNFGTTGSSCAEEEEACSPDLLSEDENAQAPQ
ncbi:unnamed protein product [Amoebophrya sp. A120]|nr:unnamed protein product [Amoebophrya sp. A120]|eukprot:GSA120T00013486001.1